MFTVRSFTHEKCPWKDNDHTENIKKNDSTEILQWLIGGVSERQRQANVTTGECMKHENQLQCNHYGKCNSILLMSFE